ncbi:MAG: precorrin-6y C5,15-methyltransferase (decarboxylating) subunit CbiE [Planctomycetes bacterium]|nr:precorrin-6y C5,15-methyltransferase (decarboxylating) subunit CbiE [Planctomycetota bacterium]
MAVNEHRITIIGCGPGSPDYLTPAARRAAAQADVLAGARRLLDLFPDVDAERIVMGADVDEVLAQIESHCGRRRRVCVLVTGDPGLCSLAKPVVGHFGRDKCEVIPGISSVQVAFARIGLDWLDATIINAHNGPPDADAGALAEAKKIAVLLGKQESLEWAAELLRSRGSNVRTFLCQDLTLGDESVTEIDPAQLGALRPPSRTILLIVDGTLLS